MIDSFDSIMFSCVYRDFIQMGNSKSTEIRVEDTKKKTKIVVDKVSGSNGTKKLPSSAR